MYYCVLHKSRVSIIKYGLGKVWAEIVNKWGTNERKLRRVRISAVHLEDDNDSSNGCKQADEHCNGGSHLIVALLGVGSATRKGRFAWRFEYAKREGRPAYGEF